jgi:hypothetical protein
MHDKVMMPVESQARAIRGMAIACAVAMLWASGASGQTVTRNPDGTISVTASELPLGQVLRAIGQVSPFEKLAIEPSAETRTVTVTLDNTPVEEALKVILDTAGVNYVLARADRLVVGDNAMLPAVQRADSVQPAPLPALAAHADLDRVEPALPSQPDQTPAQAKVEQDSADLESVLVPPSGVPTFRPSHTVLPGDNGAVIVVPLPVGRSRPSVALPGLGADPTSRPATRQPFMVTVPPELQPLIAGPPQSPSPPKK